MREHLLEVLAALEEGLVERRQPLRLCLLAALAAEHSLLIGPPGTAKSVLARRLQGAFGGVSYFERLLTRFTVPEELFGPLSITALEQDRYERQVAGFMPDAAIVFIDEVFKANSAILNALLTLLNEREFDNGAGRMICPLISTLGATNEVPDDEVGDAFLDRFLMLLPIEPVSAEGFIALMEIRPGSLSGLSDRRSRRGKARTDSFVFEAHSGSMQRENGRIWTVSPAGAADQPQARQASHHEAPVVARTIDDDLRKTIAHRAAQACLDPDSVRIMGELRAWLQSEGRYVSDRRWVKIAHLLRVACTTEGRERTVCWDLMLLPFCISPRVDVQNAVADWLLSRLGVGGRILPERLGRLAEAFEAQLDAEREANDLDYDENGRLRFSDQGLADDVGDAKGGAAAVRMSYARKRRYGETHIGARTGQIDSILAQLGELTSRLGLEREAFEAWQLNRLWVDTGSVNRIRQGLEQVHERIQGIQTRLLLARQGFEALPRLVPDSGQSPESVAVPDLMLE